MGFDNPPSGEAVRIQEEITQKAENMKQTTRFIGRMDDIDKVFTDLVHWSEGKDLDNPDKEEHYKGWQPDHFAQLLKAIGKTPDELKLLLNIDDEE